MATKITVTYWYIGGHRRTISKMVANKKAKSSLLEIRKQIKNRPDFVRFVNKKCRPSEAAKKYLHNKYKTPYNNELLIEVATKAFIAGATWQRKKSRN